MKSNVIFLVLMLPVFIFSAEAPQSAKLQSLVDNGMKSLREYKVEDALSDFKTALNVPVKNPTFKEFSLQIQAAENIVQIYQTMDAAARDNNNKDAIKKYTTFLIKKYDDAAEILKRSDDIKHAILLTTILHEMYANKGGYTSLSGQEYSLPLPNQEDMIQKQKAAYYKGNLKGLSELEKINNTSESIASDATESIDRTKAKDEATRLFKQASAILIDARVIDATIDLQQIDLLEREAEGLLQQAHAKSDQLYAVEFELAKLYAQKGADYNPDMAQKYLENAARLVGSKNAKTEQERIKEVVALAAKIENRNKAENRAGSSKGPASLTAGIRRIIGSSSSNERTLFNKLFGGKGKPRTRTSSNSSVASDQDQASSSRTSLPTTP